MTLLERYLGKTVILAIALSLVALLALTVFAEFVNHMSRLGTGHFTIGDAVLLTLLAIPQQTFELFPFAALLGSLMGLGFLAGNGELVAMRAAGFSLTDILTAIIKTVALALLVVFALGEFVAPQAEQFAKSYKAKKINKQVTFTSEHGFWARDGDGFVNIQKILPGGHLEEIYLYEFDRKNALRSATRAAFAEYKKGHWTLFNIAQSRLTDDKIVTTQRKQATWASLIDPRLLDLLVYEPSMLSLRGLSQYIDFMKANGQNATQYQVAFWTKISMPVATMVMIFLTLPVVLGNLRSAGMGQRVVVGIVAGMAFHLFSRGFSYVALAYDFQPWLMAFLPSLMVLAIGIWLLRRFN